MSGDINAATETDDSDCNIVNVRRNKHGHPDRDKPNEFMAEARLLYGRGGCDYGVMPWMVD